MGQTAQSWHCMSTLCEYSFDKITTQAFFRGLTKYGPMHTFQHAQYKKIRGLKTQNYDLILLLILVYRYYKFCRHVDLGRGRCRRFICSSEQSLTLNLKKDKVANSM